MNRKAHFIVIAVAIGLVGPASARETRQMDLATKMALSEAIALITVESIESPKDVVHGVDLFARVHVDRTLKGVELPSEIRFVVRGFSQELDPACCSKGQQYLIFAKRGYPVFSTGEEVSIIQMGKSEYFSAVNGPYSAYRICGDKVIGWFHSPSGQGDEALKRVINEIATAAKM